MLAVLNLSGPLAAQGVVPPANTRSGATVDLTPGTARLRPVAAPHPARWRDGVAAAPSVVASSASTPYSADPDPAAERVARQRPSGAAVGDIVRATRIGAAPYAPAEPLAPPVVGTGYATTTLASGTPPDTQLAVGPNHVVVAQNGSVTIHDKTTNAVISTVSLGAFWNNTVGFTRVFDPRIRFDASIGRFIFVTLTDSRLPTSNILVAVSATSDPTGAWTRYAFLNDPVGDLWADYPQIGYSSDKVVVGFNSFSISTGQFDSANLLVLPKAAVASGGVAAASIEVSDQLDFSPAPSANFDANQPDLWIVSAREGTNDSLSMVRLSGPVAALVYTPRVLVVGDPWSFGQSPFVVPQTGGSISIRSADDRIETVTLRAGTVYATHQVFLGSPARSVVQWWAFDTTGRRAQYGRLDSGSANVQYAFPSLAVNKRGDVSFAFARFSNDSFPSAATAFHAFDDATGVIPTSPTVKSGEAFYTGPVVSPPQQRWGDYTGSTTDPSDDVSFWHAAEYSGAGGSQANWVWKTDPAALPSGQGYVALAPARILDTRSDTTVNGTGRPVPALTEIDVPVGGLGGVPVTATAVALNVTVTGPVAAGFITVYPKGGLRPDASSLNYATAQNVPNLVIARLGNDASVRVYTSATTHVIVDVQGYFDPASVERYHPLAPVRSLDTRPVGLVGTATAGPVVANGFVDLQVTGLLGVPASGVSAVVLNVTATGGSGPGFVTVHPADVVAPNASNLNFTTTDAANLVYAKVSADGRVRLSVRQRSVHLLADVQGWFGSETAVGRGFTSVLSPSRVLDTRSGVGVLGSARVAAGQEIELRVNGIGGLRNVPFNTTAVIVNLTATGATAAGYATVYPSGGTRPNASNLNFVANRDVANSVEVPIGSDGKIRFYVSASTHLVADLQGWVTSS